MSAKFGLYKLIKVVGKKEYTPTLIEKYPSQCKAMRELSNYFEEYFNDDEMLYGGGRCYFNKKTSEVETYILHNNLLYLPNYAEDRIIGVWRNSPIYIIDKYPCPFAKYKLHIDNRGWAPTIKMEGISE